MRSTDLVPLFGPEPGGVGFRQGTVLEWNPLTAENTIGVGGANLQNIPILNTSEALLLRQGDVVALLTTGEGAQSWFIVGRVTIPGTPQAASALAMVANSIVGATDSGAGTTGSGSFTDLTGASVGPQVTVNISATGKALCFMSCELGFTSAFEESSTAAMSVAVSGATTVAANDLWGTFFELDSPTGSPIGNQESFYMQAAGFHWFDNLNQGSNTFCMKYKTASAGGSDPDTVRFRQREIAVLAL